MTEPKYKSTNAKDLTRRLRCGQLSDEKSDISQIAVAEIKVATENDLLYGRFAIANDDDYRLFLSVKAHGVAEPLVLSADGILLSGHRRLAAAKYARP